MSLLKILLGIHLASPDADPLDPYFAAHDPRKFSSPFPPTPTIIWAPAFLNKTIRLQL
jgi:hypothetical protein